MIFSRRDLFKIILPLIGQQLLTVLVGMIDSMMVSSAGETAVSGVSLINTLDVLLITLFNSLVTGGSVVISQAIGRKDMKVARNSCKQLVYATAIVALAVTTLSVLLRKPLLNMLYGNVEAEVMGHALDYFFYMSLSFPFLAITSGCYSIFRCMGNSLTPMLSSLLTNGLNVVGNAVLIYGFDLAAKGAAIATLIARMITTVVAVTLLHNRKNMIYLEKMWQYRPDFKVIKRILQIGIPNGVENSMFQFGKLLVQSLVSTMGTVAIAANAVANTFSNLQYQGGSSINMGTVPIVGRCIGAGDKKQATFYSRLLIGLSYGFMILSALVILIFGKQLVGLYHLSAESTALALKIIMIHSIVAVLIWPLGFGFPNAFRAAGDVRFTMIISVISMWVFRVGFGHILSVESLSVFGLTIPGFGMGVLGVWFGMFLDWLFRAAVFSYRHFSGRWLKHMNDF